MFELFRKPHTKEETECMVNSVAQSVIIHGAVVIHGLTWANSVGLVKSMSTLTTKDHLRSEYIPCRLAILHLLCSISSCVCFPPDLIQMMITMIVAGHIDKTCVRNARDLDTAVVILIEHDTSFTYKIVMN